MQDSENLEADEDDGFDSFARMRTRRLHLPRRGDEMFGRRHLRNQLLEQGASKITICLHRPQRKSRMEVLSVRSEPKSSNLLKEAAGELFRLRYRRFRPLNPKGTRIGIRIVWNLSEDTADAEAECFARYRHQGSITLMDPSGLDPNYLNSSQKALLKVLEKLNPTPSHVESECCLDQRLVKADFSARSRREHPDLPRRNEKVDSAVERIFKIHPGRKPYSYHFTPSGELHYIQSRAGIINHFRFHERFRHIPDPVYAEVIRYKHAILREHSLKELSADRARLHCDVELPQEIPEEMQEVLDLCREFKQGIIQKIPQDESPYHQESLCQILDHVGSFLPWVWLHGEKTRVVWNLFNFQLYSLGWPLVVWPDTPAWPRRFADPEDKDYNAETHQDAEWKLSMAWNSLARDPQKPFQVVTNLNPCSHAPTDARIRANTRGPERKVLLHPPGSLEHARNLLQQILDLDWPVEEAQRKDLLPRSPDMKSVRKMQDAIQKLVRRVLPDRKLLDLCKANPDNEIHLAYRVLEQMPHLVPIAATWPGVFNWLLETESPESDNFPGMIRPYTKSSNNARWQKNNIVESLLKTPTDRDGALDLLFPPECHKTFSRNQMNNLLRRLPVVFHPNLCQHGQDPVRNQEIPEKFFDSRCPFLEDLLSLPLDMIPEGAKEWHLFESCILSDQDSCLLRGLWLNTLREYRQGLRTPDPSQEVHTPETRRDILVKRNLNMTQEIRDILRNCHKASREIRAHVGETLTDGVFQNQYEKFINRFYLRGKKSILRTMNRWNTHSHHLSNLDSEAYFHTTGMTLEESWRLVVWPAILPEPRIENGWTVTEICNVQDLKEHGGEMSHCVGSYAESCLNEDRASHILKFSRPDEKIPQGTLEIIENPDGRLIQNSFMGHHNNPIEDEGLLEAAKTIQQRMQNALDRDLKTWQKHSHPIRRENQQKILENRGSPKQRYLSCLWHWRLLQKIVRDMPDPPPEFFEGQEAEIPLPVRVP